MEKFKLSLGALQEKVIKSLNVERSNVELCRIIYQDFDTRPAMTDGTQLGKQVCRSAINNCIKVLKSNGYVDNHGTKWYLTEKGLKLRDFIW